MPTCPTLHSYMKTLAASEQDDPKEHYLLGFERDKIKPLPVKTYIRRLWLAFQSSKKSSLPRCFFDAEAEKFAKEVEAWASDFVKDEDRLAFEIAKDPTIVDEQTNETGSAFLQGVARTMLVTREWGDHLWGHRKFCTSPLQNAKPEPGDDKPPQWPKDEKLITTAVRHWLAARIQDKLQNPRQAKLVPRIQCPQNAAQRREAIVAVFPNTTLYDSDEEIAPLVPQEATDTKEEVIQSQCHQQDPRHQQYFQRTESTGKRKHLTDASDRDRLHLSGTNSASLAGQRGHPHEKVTEASSIYLFNPEYAPSSFSNRCLSIGKLDAVVPCAAPVAPVARKGESRIKYVKPSRTSMRARKKRTELQPTPKSSKICPEVPLTRPDGYPDRHSLAFAKDLGAPQAGHASGSRFCKPTCSTKDIGSQVQKKQHLSNKGHDSLARTATQIVDEVDIDFTLLGDPSADAPGDSF